MPQHLADEERVAPGVHLDGHGQVDRHLVELVAGRLLHQLGHLGLLQA
jgi:hypothetical protein